MSEFEDKVNGVIDVENSSDDIFFDGSAIPQMEEEVSTSVATEVAISVESTNKNLMSEIDVRSNTLSDSSHEDDILNDNLLEESESPSKINHDIQDDASDMEKSGLGVRLPLARVKKIMKCDPFLGLASQDSIFLVAKATELFIESLAIEAYHITSASKKKTVSRKDMETVIDRIDALAFLDGALD